MRLRQKKGVETLKRRYGLLFVTPWAAGTVLFFLIPLIQSVQYSFSEVTLVPGGLKTEFVWIGQFRELLLRDLNYTGNVRGSMVQLLYSMPLIVIVSLILALLLNQRFHGRVFFRALFFLPVIIATGNVMMYLPGGSVDTMTSTVAEGISQNMFTVSDVMNWLSLPPAIALYIQIAVSRIFDLIWSSGIQIVLFIAGLQSIPSSLYEAGRVEGATKWEEFWFITFPMLAHVIILVGLFTMTEILTDIRNPVMQQATRAISGGNFGQGAAAAWLYFALVCGLMGLTVGLFSRFAKKRWDA